MNGAPAKPISGTVSSLRSSRIDSRTNGTAVSGSNGVRSRATSAAVRMGESTTGPTPSSIRTSTPRAATGTMMSENRIAASSGIRRSGCSVTSTARSGVRHVSSMSRPRRSSRYSGR